MQFFRLESPGNLKKRIATDQMETNDRRIECDFVNTKLAMHFVQLSY